jgi:hypothetical protein
MPQELAGWQAGKIPASALPLDLRCVSGRAGSANYSPFLYFLHSPCVYEFTLLQRANPNQRAVQLDAHRSPAA